MLTGSHKKYVSFFLVIVFFLVSTFVTAQHFNAKPYGVAEGFKGSSVQNIFADSHGYLWISTYSDLLRFDGTNFTRFGADDGLTGNTNTLYFEDSHHTLWGTSRNGRINKVIYFLNGKFSSLAFDSKDSIGYIFSFYETSNKALYVCTDRGVFARMYNRFKKIDVGIDASMYPVRNIVKTKDNSIFYCTPFYISLKEPNKKIRIIADTSVAEQFNSIISTGKNIVILGSNRIFLYDSGSLKNISADIFKKDYIISAATDHNGGIYACGIDTGVFYFTNNQTQQVKTNENLAYGFLHTICEDREGDIWMGSLKLFRLRPAYIEHFTQSDGMQSTDTRSVLFTKKGIGFFGQGVFSIRTGNNFISATSLLKKNDIQKFENHIPYCMQDDEQGRIWMMLTPNRLVRYHDQKLEDINPLFNPQHKSVGQIVFDAVDSSMYISTDSILHIKNDRIVQKIPINKNHNTDKPFALCFDMKHHLWVGTRNGNLGYIDLNNKHFYESQNINARKIVAMPDGTVWVSGFGNGIYHYKINATGEIVLISNISEKDELPSNTVWDIVSDRQGFLWVTTSDGLIQYKIVSKNNGDSIAGSHLFGLDDGLQPASFVDSHLGVDSAGNVWVTTYEGVYRINEKDIVYDSVTPNVQIERIAVLNDSTNGNQYAKFSDAYFHLPVGPILPYDKNTITIFFNSIAYSVQNEVQCEYKLEGLSNNWTNSNPNSNAAYVNLPAGHYVFHVRARRKNFTWSNDTTFAFTIQPPYWQTWWFSLIVIAIASSVLIIAFRFRIQQINRKASVQQQIQQLEMQALKARMNPHFIYNAMNSIQSLIMSNEPESAVRYLGKFAKLLRQVLDNSDQQLIPLERELSSLRLYIELEALRLNLDFDYSIQVEEDIDTSDEFVPPLTLQPFVENALWHGLSNKQGPKKLMMHVCINENYLTVAITDNGIGRTKSAEIKSRNANASASKGLGITERRLALLNNNDKPVVIEDLFAENGNAAGTKVIIQILRHV